MPRWPFGGDKTPCIPSEPCDIPRENDIERASVAAAMKLASDMPIGWYPPWDW